MKDFSAANHVLRMALRFIFILEVDPPIGSTAMEPARLCVCEFFECAHFVCGGHFATLCAHRRPARGSWRSEGARGCFCSECEGRWGYSELRGSAGATLVRLRVICEGCGACFEVGNALNTSPSHSGRVQSMTGFQADLSGKFEVR